MKQLNSWANRGFNGAAVYFAIAVLALVFTLATGIARSDLYRWYIPVFFAVYGTLTVLSKLRSRRRHR
jgi:hypothetical protein